MTVAELVARITADTRDLDAGLTEAERRVRASHDRIQGVADKMRDVGTRLSMAVTLPIVGMGVAAVRVAADYEQTMNVLRATTGATAQEMAAIGRLAQQLGADLWLPGTSAKDAAEAMLEMSKAGMSLSDTMAAARGVLQMSAAAQMSNAEAAELTANALNAFRLPGSEAGRVADLLAGASKSASGSIRDMGYALQMSAAVAAQAGVPIEDLTTAIAMMANAGILGSDAGTSIKTMLLRLMAPTGEAARLMAQLGISTYDAWGRFKGLRPLIGEFSQTLGTMNEAQRNAALATIFGTDAIRAANVVLMQGVGAWDALQSQVTQAGVAAQLSAAQNQGLNGALDALRSAVESLALAMAPWLNMLAGAIRLLAGLVNALTALPMPIQAVVLGLMGLAAMAGPVALLASTVLRLYGAMLLVQRLGVSRAALSWLGVGAAGAGGAAAGAAGAAGAGAAAGARAAAGAAGALGIRAMAARIGAGALRGLRAGGPFGLGAQIVGHTALSFAPEGYFRSIASGALTGGGFGAAIGSAVPGLGTMLGGVGGAIIGGAEAGIRRFLASRAPVAVQVNAQYDNMPREVARATEAAMRRYQRQEMGRLAFGGY